MSVHFAPWILLINEFDIVRVRGHHKLSLTQMKRPTALSPLRHLSTIAHCMLSTFTGELDNALSQERKTNTQHVGVLPGTHTLSHILNVWISSNIHRVTCRTRNAKSLWLDAEVADRIPQPSHHQGPAALKALAKRCFAFESKKVASGQVNEFKSSVLAVTIYHWLILALLLYRTY